MESSVPEMMKPPMPQTQDPTWSDEALSYFQSSRPLAIPPPPYEKEDDPVSAPGQAWTNIYSASQDNFENSPLLRLPDEVLVHIMNQSDKDGILRLRHVSRTFMRLFTEVSDFEEMWLDDQDQIISRVWRAPADQYEGQGRPVYCEDCALIEGDTDKLISDFNLLWCSGCRKAHSEIHFSHIQRAEDDDDRICIGREGRVKLCSHGSISWAQVRHMAKATGAARGVACSYDSHRGLQCSGDNCPFESGAEVQVSLTEDGEYAIQFSSCLHIPFRRGLDGEKPKWLRFFNDIHEVTANADNEEFLPSRFFPGCDPTRAFDPNLCSCLDWNVSPAEEESSSDPNVFKWHLSDRDCGLWRDPAPPRRGRSHHGFTVHLGSRSVDIEFLQCGDDGNMLVLRQATRIFVKSPTDPGWEDLIDSRSILLVRDEKMKGVTWCLDPHCALNTQKMSGYSIKEFEYNLLEEKRRERSSTQPAENVEDENFDDTDADAGDEASSSDEIQSVDEESESPLENAGAHILRVSSLQDYLNTHQKQN